MATTTAESSLLDKLNEFAPAPLKSFDAFPKLPSTYKSRSESRGFLTLFVSFLAFLLVLNDIGEFIWGWPDYEFSVDHDAASFMKVNVDLMVNMPCRYLSVDLRDVVGDRMYLSKGFRRDGTLFDIGQATSLREHAEALSARQAVSQSRNSRGLFSLFRRSTPAYKPTYNHTPDGSACRIFGSLDVKKVTANLHITTLGHGYASNVHVDHSAMNMSHVITEFSFGPYFPDITQPLDNSFEITHEPFVAYQYYLRVVPTTYIAPRSNPLVTNQYSVTHYTHTLDHNRGTPGIFFKFDMEPVRLTIHQRTTTLAQFLIRWAGVVGGVFVCTAWALRITTRAVTIVAGPSDEDNITPTESAHASGLRRKWVGGALRARPGSQGRVIRQGNSWVVEGGSPYSSYAGTPVSAVSGTPYSPFSPATAPLPPPPMSGRSVSGGSLSAGGPGFGLGLPSSAFGPASARSPAPGQPSGFPTAATAGSPYPGSVGIPAQSLSPSYTHFPPTPNPGSTSFPRSPLSTERSRTMSGDGKKDD
ncbi:hypothetical protein EW146_g2115 [Bondarzewia mesenterica]|uniref:Endoplasmic reticulum vesicle transporter C-terminal domain-containing protein n=1 Tax=Bondarzewia mesenterica TaxID=1095465 RepID=A0A4S4M1M5_9AGAM|nr:hypothetical protein EW146_g2115 [Bondarzewia mesenterica]